MTAYPAHPTSPAGVPVLDLEPFDKAFLADPYPAHERPPHSRPSCRIRLPADADAIVPRLPERQRQRRWRYP